MNTSKLHRLMTRVVAAALAAGTTWMLFGGVISISEPQRNAMIAAIAARQVTPMSQATLMAAAAAPHSDRSQAR